MKKLLGAVALAGAAYAGLAAYAARQGRDVADVAGSLAGRANGLVDRTADRLNAFAEAMTETKDDPPSDAAPLLDLTSTDKSDRPSTRVNGQ